ncbi:MAG TPA: hypothetical protein VK464_15795 [Symbiobacteriaceae bacterium]|jgi:hypothetical protein|nr:hypothetical protein [Symbiobacteriaceae bacterium]
MELISFIVGVVTILAIWGIYFRTRAISESQERTERLLEEIRDALRAREEPTAPKGPKTCIRCLAQVPRNATKCPQCGHFFGLA